MVILIKKQQAKGQITKTPMSQVIEVYETVHPNNYTLRSISKRLLHDSRVTVALVEEQKSGNATRVSELKIR
jgi:hypothetical protein